MNNTFYVYEHIRKDTNTVFYVGKGKNNRAYTSVGRNQYWKNVVSKAGGFDVKIITKDIDEELAFLVEIERIDQLKRLGIQLTNLTNGGEGMSGYTPTEETKKKMKLSWQKRNSNFWRIFDQITSLHLSWNEGHPLTNEQKHDVDTFLNKHQYFKVFFPDDPEIHPPLVCHYKSYEGGGHGMWWNPKQSRYTKRIQQQLDLYKKNYTSS